MITFTVTYKYLYTEKRLTLTGKELLTSIQLISYLNSNFISALAGHECVFKLTKVSTLRKFISSFTNNNISKFNANNTIYSNKLKNIYIPKYYSLLFVLVSLNKSHVITVENI